MGRRIPRIAGLVLAVPIVLLALVTLISAFVYSPEYVRRVYAWRMSDVDDYRYNFPQRPLAASPVPFQFVEPADMAATAARVEGLFETLLEIDDFQSFLEESRTEAFLVIQDDTLVYEQYANGAQRDTLMTSFSVAKSFTSALIGIAIAEGHIGSVDDPITVYLPELAERDPAFEAITIRHLLLMASGLAYQEMRPGLFNGDDLITTYLPDQRQAALEYTRLQDPPGAYFSYNKYHPQLLGLILERTTGVRVTEYLQQKIWDPLGMEYAGSWSLDSETSSFEKMETGVNARAVDYAKFGRLFLEGGQWQGVQVVPQEWVAESTRVDPATHTAAYYPDEFGQSLFSTLNGYYKYMWYGFFREEDSGWGYDFQAEGDRGQFIYVSPYKQLVIVRNGLDWGITGESWIRAFYDFAGQF